MFRAKSPWVYFINTGSCNGCDIEVLAIQNPRYSAERYGVLRVGSPRHADVLVVTGADYQTHGGPLDDDL